jgi:hypothetical protein
VAVHVARSSPEGESGAAVVIGLGCARQGGKEVQMGPVFSPGSARQKREGEEVGTGAERGGDDVAAGGRLGRSWHVRNRTGGEG